MTLSKSAAKPPITETVVVRTGNADDAAGAWRVFETHLNWINVSCNPEDVILRRQSYSYTQQVFITYPTAVAVIDGLIVGYAATERRDLGVLEVVNVFVNDAFRNTGIGTKLIEALEAQCEAEGFHTLIAFASDAYYPGKRLPTSLFERQGYELRELSRATQMYVKQLAVETDERKSTRDAKRVIFRTILRTERFGDNDVVIFSDLEEIHPDSDPDATDITVG